MNGRNKLIIVIALAAIASLAIFIAIDVLVPRYDYFPGGGICFHKPQDIVDHQIEPKMMIRTYNNHWMYVIPEFPVNLMVITAIAFIGTLVTLRLKRGMSFQIRV